MKQLILIVSLILLSFISFNKVNETDIKLFTQNKERNIINPDNPDQLPVSQNKSYSKLNASGNISDDWYSAAIEKIRLDEYNITYNEKLKTYQSPNRANNIRFTYHKDGFKAETRETKIPLFDINDSKISEKDKKYEEVEDWNIELKIMSYGSGIMNEELTSAGNKTSIENENIRIDYTNSIEGMRQDFIVKKKLSDENDLNLTMNVNTSLKMKVRNDAVSFSSNDGSEKMQYASLKAWDAKMKELNAYFESKSEDQFAIRVDDRDAEYPVTIDPLSISPDWVTEGYEIGDEFGFSVSDAGDVNVDGYTDVIIGSPGFNNGQTSEGKVYVFFGSEIGLSSNAGWSFESNEENSRFGYSVAGAGDINGDGFPDIIVGAPYYSNGEINEGRIYVFYGSNFGLSNSPNWTFESNVDSAKTGFSVSTAGDFNNDNYEDILIGSPGYKNNFLNINGCVSVFLSSSSGLSDSANYNFFNHKELNTGIGTTVSCAGDVNKDGFSDIVFGEPFWQDSTSQISGNGFDTPGRVNVIYGTSSGIPNQWITEGKENHSLFGYSVSSAGDANGDGYSDVAVGSPTVNTCYIYKGSSSGLSESQYYIVTDPNGYGEHITNIGIVVSSAGDINADGYTDLVTGGDWAINETGKAVFVYFGSNFGYSEISDWHYYYSSERNFTLSISKLDDVNGDGYSEILVGMKDYSGFPALPSAEIFFGGLTIERIEADWVAPDEGEDNIVGYSVSSDGDVNGDGFDDFIFGSPVSENSQSNIGKAHVYYGGNSLPGETPDWTASGGRDFGSVVSAAGDVNNDGYDDVLIADPTYEEGGRFGKIYLYLGSSNGLSIVPSWTRTSPGIGGNFGSSISDAGDVNGDNYADIVIGTGDYQLYGSMYVGGYVFYGNSSGIPDNQPSWTVSSEIPINGFGNSISKAGDVNGDGYDDIIVSAYKYLENYTGGKVFVYFGRNQKPIFDPPDWQIQNDFGFGYAVSNAGDINADGYDDVMISSIYTDDFNGRVYIYKGSNNGLSNTADWQITGIYQSLFGTDIACGGDYNRDGYADILVGEIQGNAYVYYGSETGISESINSRFSGSSIQSLSGSMDINGDGNSDVIIGMLYASNNSYYYSALVFLGKNDNLFSFPKRTLHSINNQHCIKCNLRTASGNPINGALITISIYGANSGSAETITNSLGEATYCYIGTNFGIDTIVVNKGILSDTSLVFWDYPLPVELSSFTSSVSGRDVTLNWSTANELNNSGFEIERAVDNGQLIIDSWDKAGFVEGNGTTNEPKQYTFTDKNLQSGNYKYRLKQTDFNGNFEYFELDESVSIGIPDKFELSQNYPNPFNPATTINYDLPKDGLVTIKIYDTRGREVKTLLNEIKTSGYHRIQFNAADLSSGAYFYRMTAGEFSAVKKFIVLK